MFLHIGGDVMVRVRDVIGIFDARLATKLGRDVEHVFVDSESGANLSGHGNSSDVKSLVLTKDKLYFSPISSATLKRRAENTDPQLKLGLD